MAATPEQPEGPSSAPGDPLLRAGGVVLVAGMLVTLVAMLPLVSDLEMPTAFWWLSILLVGSGLGLMLLGLLRAGRTRSRLQRAARPLSDG